MLSSLASCPLLFFPVDYLGSGSRVLGLTGPGSLTHPPVVPVSISQMQPPVQGFVALQVPRQTGSTDAWVRNWRAETVPAQSTAVKMTASNVFLMVFLLRIFAFLSCEFVIQIQPRDSPVALIFFAERSLPLFNPSDSQLFCRRRLDDARARYSSGRNGAEAEDTAARYPDAARGPANCTRGSMVPQLPGGNSSGAENTNNQCGKEH